MPVKQKSGSEKTATLNNRTFRSVQFTITFPEPASKALFKMAQIEGVSTSQEIIRIITIRQLKKEGYLNENGSLKKQ